MNAHAEPSSGWAGNLMVSSGQRRQLMTALSEIRHIIRSCIQSGRQLRVNWRHVCDLSNPMMKFLRRQEDRIMTPTVQMAITMLRLVSRYLNLEKS